MPNQYFIDLHTHTNCSDGTYSPRELVTKAADLGLKAIAITDHDTVDGIAEAIKQGTLQQLDVLPGVELSVMHKKTPLHLLGYGFRYDDTQFKNWLNTIQRFRVERNNAILAKLNKIGIGVNETELKAISTKGQTGRPHIANLLVKKKIVQSVNEAFQVYLKRNGKAYVSREPISATEAIQAINSAGGLAVLAHPGTIALNFTMLSELITELEKVGLNGLEIYYPIHSVNLRKRLKKLAQKKGLLITGGSDFHGEIRNDIPLGRKSEEHDPV